ncbi:MAG: HAD-IA family hydrolase [bacterium]
MVRRLLILDAMGVVFDRAHLTQQLLAPFVHDHGATVNIDTIRSQYRLASSGEISSEAFWQSLGIDPGLEAEYLEQYQLNQGFETFATHLPQSIAGCWYLSNDVSSWASGLRQRFQLDHWFDGYVISADVGARKPDPAIYQVLLERAAANAIDCIFVDDKPENLETARSLGMITILFDPQRHYSEPKHPVVHSFQQLTDTLS